MAESIQQAVSDLSTRVAETMGVTGQQTGQEKTRGGVETEAQGGESSYSPFRACQSGVLIQPALPSPDLAIRTHLH